MHALIALSTAASKVGPRPIPLAPVIGQNELATTSLAEACAENNEVASIDANRIFFMIFPVSPYWTCGSVSLIPACRNSILQPIPGAKTVHPFRLLPFLFSALAAIALPATALKAETAVAPDAHLQQDGVRLDAYSRNGKITFCFNAEKDVKIASEYGVEFTVPQGEAKLWNEVMPKLVAGSEPYFELPVRIDLKTLGAAGERRVSMGLGVCVSAKYCTPVSLEITVPAASGVAGEPVCSN